ncbi:MAG: hypothetical protein IKB64_08395 [Paludibacteraceae bacterium]|nr:hypothetical protein [Paludibacteraceae bacterium]
MNNATIEERLTQLENYIGDMKQLKFYANSLQEALDRYVSPLYIEKTDNEGNSLYIDSYLGRPDAIPPYSMIKVRASHTLNITGTNTGTKIIFKRGEEIEEYPLMKMVADDNLFEELETGDFVNGNIYEIYFNAQNIAIISSSNSGVTALNLVQQLNTTVEALRETIDKLGITDTGMTVTGTIIANKIETKEATIEDALDLTTVEGLILPAGTKTQDPTTNEGIATKQFVENHVSNELTDFFAKKHIVGTGEASTVMESQENDSFYFKIGD